jgi:hypothetical protein
MAEERRSGGRHTFTASADVVEIGSGARFSTRMTDLSHGGCFVDTMVPFPVGAKVRVKVYEGKREFDTEGIVVYSQYGLGMGVAFGSLDPQRSKALDEWIQELSGERESSQADLARSAGPASRIAADENTRVIKLVQLLIGKGLITETEGASILNTPLF